MKTKIAFLFSVVVISGCATWGDFRQNLDGLIGQPLSVAIDKIGYPSAERTIAGKHLFEWGRSNDSAVYMPTTSTTFGNVSTPGGFRTYTGTTTGGMFIPINYRCSITMEVDQQNIILNYQYEGNLGGCEPYIQALGRK